jgi:hypothetical protein
MPTSTVIPSEAQFVYVPLVLRNLCQIVEDEGLYPNNTVDDALENPPLCRGVVFTGKHNRIADREDIYQIIVPVTTTLDILLDVADLNLNLRLYDATLEEIATSVQPGTIDESVFIEVPAGHYVLRVYRADEEVSEVPYRLRINTE